MNIKKTCILLFLAVFIISAAACETSAGKPTVAVANTAAVSVSSDTGSGASTAASSAVTSGISSSASTAISSVTAPSQTAKSAGNPIVDDPASKGNLALRSQQDPQYPGNRKTAVPETAVTDSLPPNSPPPSVSVTTATSKTTTKPTTAPPMSSSNTSLPTSGTIGSSSTNPSTTAASPPSTGWYVSGSDVYYYYNGKPVTGWQTMGGVRYFFNSSGVLSSQVGIDVSEYQGKIDWAKVRASGVTFAFLRVGFRGWGAAGNVLLDAQFKNNIINATAAGVNCGVYFYSQAITADEAVAEANFTLAAIKGFTLTYPVVIDTEDAESSSARTNNLTTAQRTDICKAFMNTVKSAGYYPMIYSNTDWLVNHVNMASLSAFDVWVAQYANSVTYPSAYRAWQYTSVGAQAGITGNVDRDVGLFDYSVYIKQNHYNGF